MKTRVYIRIVCFSRAESRKLMEAGIKELQKNYSEIRLNVFAGNFAKEMYEQFGFVERQVIMTLK